jgi:peptide/nickel transport system permease protein
MGRYIVKRLAWTILVMLFVSFLTYVIYVVMPSADPTEIFTHGQRTARASLLMREQFGLNRSLWAQYATFTTHVFLGDRWGWPGLGYSFYTRSSLRPILLGRMVITAQLVAGAALVWLGLGISAGILSALHPRSVRDRLAMGFSLVAISTPVFWLGLLFLYVFWYRLRWAPDSGYAPIGTFGFWAWLAHWILPWIVLALLFAAFYARMSRANMIEVLGEDFIRTARGKGLSERRVTMHAMRASVTPLVTMFGMDVGTLLGGAIITERVFNLQGLGSYAVDSVTRGDLFALADISLIAAFFITIMNLVVDILYAALDPRVRYR